MIVRVLLIIALCYVSSDYAQNDEDRDYGDDTDTRAYTLPPPKFEAIWPRGLKVSVRDDYYSFMAFHGNLNVKFQGLEEGHWNKEMRQNKNGKWIFKDRNVELKIGDKIYFWTYAIKNGREYRLDNGLWTVTRYIDDKGSAVYHTNVSPTSEPTQAPSIQTTSPKPANVPACKTSATAVSGLNTVCATALIFSEEFNGKSLRELTNWQAESKFPEEPDYPFNVYMTEPDKIMKFEDGALVISPVLLEDYKNEGFIHESLDLSNRCTGQAATTECKRQANGAYILPPVITGKITTKNKFSFKYGRVEIRAKLPAGSWLLPEINLEPQQNFYGSRSYESGLMRVAFAKGNDVFAKKLYGGPVLSDSDPYRTLLLKQKIGIENWNQDFHNYTMIWKPDGLQLLVDEEEYGTVSPGEGFYVSAKQNAVVHAGNWLKGSVMAPLDQMFYVSLGLRVGGINDFQDEPDKPWRNKSSKATVSFYNAKEVWFPTWYDANLKVDYVRIYAL